MWVGMFGGKCGHNGWQGDWGVGLVEGAWQLRLRVQALSGCVGSGLGGRRDRCWVGRLIVRELVVELAGCEQQLHHTVCLVVVPQGLQHLDRTFCLPTPFP